MVGSVLLDGGGERRDGSRGDGAAAGGAPCTWLSDDARLESPKEGIPGSRDAEACGCTRVSRAEFQGQGDKHCMHMYM